MENLIKDRLNYNNSDILYYVGPIYEYDIKNAYPAILYDTEFKFTDENLRNEITKIVEENTGYIDDKRSFLIRIGKEMKYNPSISEYINNVLKDSIERFQIENNITKNDIISIKKDALFVIKRAKITKFNNLDFIIKNKYSMYFYEYNDKHEYYINKFRDEIDYSIKGIGKGYDKSIYDKVCNMIYSTITTGNFSLIEQIQNLFLLYDEKNIEMLKKYLPSTVPFKNLVYIDIDEYLKYTNFSNDEIKEIYFKYYANPAKTLIQYLL